MPRQLGTKMGTNPGQIINAVYAYGYGVYCDYYLVGFIS